MTQGSGHDGGGYPSGSVDLESAGAFTQGFARGHDIIDQQNVFSRVVAVALEGVTHIYGPCLVGQLRLDRRGPPAGAVPVIAGYVEFPGEGTQDFAGLIEPALAQSAWMQGKGDGQVEVAALQRHGQAPPEPGRQGQLMPIFQRLDQAVGREGVGKERDTGIEMGRGMETAATALTVGRWDGALGAARGRQGG